MDISDYSELAARAEEYYGADDLFLEFARFVGMAEIKLNRRLRVSDMETAGTIILTDGDGSLPTDFLEMRDCRFGSYPALRAWPIQTLKNRYAYGGVPKGYAVVGSTLSARPKTTGDLDIVYWAKIPSLTLANATNWLLMRAPEIYLYAVCCEMALWQRDVEKGQGFTTLLNDAVDALKSEDRSRTYGNARVVVGGFCP